MMKNQKGIWLDQKSAFVITISDGKHNLTQFNSEIESKERIAGEGKDSGKFGGQAIDSESKKDRRISSETNTFIDKVLSQIEESDNLVVFGPAEMKIELEKKILGNGQLKNMSYAIETADSMSENQMIAWVKNYIK